MAGSKCLGEASEQKMSCFAYAPPAMSAVNAVAASRVFINFMMWFSRISCSGHWTPEVWGAPKRFSRDRATGIITSQGRDVARFFPDNDPCWNDHLDPKCLRYL